MEDTKSAGNVYAILSYLWVLCLIPLLFKKDDEFVIFHAKQGLVLFILEVALGIIGIVPFLGPIVVMLGTIFCGIISLVGIIKVLMGEKWEIPVLGEWARKIKV